VISFRVLSDISFPPWDSNQPAVLASVHLAAAGNCQAPTNFGSFTKSKSCAKKVLDITQ